MAPYITATLLLLSLVPLFCVRHFLVQLLSAKLLLSTVIYIIMTWRPEGQFPSVYQTIATIILSAMLAVFFILLSVVGRTLNRGNTLDVDHIEGSEKNV